jgi:BCD family chlorophyll transporter-like MFS transporter
VVFSDPLNSPWLFRAGALLIGFGGGLFAVGTLTAAMNMAGDGTHSGLALGAWGAVQATAYGVGIAFGGAVRDIIGMFAAEGVFGPVLMGPSVGYAVVYHLEILLLFATLIAIGPLVTHGGGNGARSSTRFGIPELP